MERWLWAALLLATAGAWRPPARVRLAPPPLVRARRDAPAVHRLRLLGWSLELQDNPAIRSPGYDRCRFYTGHILHEPDSAVTLTDCEGQLYGLLRSGGEEFVLTPSAGAHVLRRRDALREERPVAYDVAADTVTDLELGLEEDDPAPRAHSLHRDDDDVDYFRGPRLVTRPLSGDSLWLEMAIVADHTMLKFHGHDRVKHYILALMNIVSAIYNDPSLGSNMTLIINKLYLYEEKDPVIKYGNVKKTLESVNKWNYRHLMKLPKDTTGWDAGVWLTRAPLGGPSGFAPVSGVCSRARSGAIVRDEGLTSAFVIAHELGHLLGLTHDGESDCATEALRKYVMAPTVLATLHNYTWSTCSREQFQQKSRKWWCLQERSQDEGVELGGARELSNYVFTMDEQCRTEFGEGFSVCKSVKVRSACSRLWCAHRAVPHVCRSKRAPPMEGTPCGRNKWCVQRVCEPMPGRESSNAVEPDPEPPRWEEWGEWSQCSADCGYGLRLRKRHCVYQGSISETACEGAASQAATCWAGSACAAVRDIRADACARHDRHLIPHVHSDESKQCEAWCVEYAGGAASELGSLPDGAPCSYDRQFDICYQGTCVRGQCNASDPVCNWCPDGYCNNNTHYYTRQLAKGWTRITVVPHEAHQLSVHIATPVALSIAIRERRRERHIVELSKHHLKRFEIEQNNYLKYDPSVPQNLRIIEVDSNIIDIKEGSHQGWEGAVAAAGTLLRWKQTDSDVYITTTSKLQTDLMIMAIPETLVVPEELVTVEVAVNYSTPAGRTRPLEYRWSTERGPCSASCGGGMRAVRPRCSRASCAPLRYEHCNVHSCEFSWAPAEWEECSATCGSDGIQERQLFCVPQNASVSSRREMVRHSVSPALCAGAKPDARQPCNRIPCPVYWQEMPWTPCSTTCGRGYSRRPLVCPAADEHLCGPRPRERRRRCRVRRCPAPPRACPAADGTQYCELFTTEQLIRNCQVPPFRKYCCNACRKADKRRGTG